MSEAPLYCATGIPELYRNEAGRIVYGAFRRKLQPLLGAPAQIERILAADLQLDTAIGAFAGERLVGVACLSEGGRRAARVRLRDFTQCLGPLRGLYSWLALGLFEAGRCPHGELRLAILAVEGALRGRGVGSRLLEAVFAYAEQRSLGAVRLDVVDTNLGARQLYERVGFVPVRTVPVFPLFPAWLGFSAVIEMVRPLTHRQPALNRPQGADNGAH